MRLAGFNRRQALQLLGVGLASSSVLLGCKEEHAATPVTAPPPAPVAAPPKAEVAPPAEPEKVAAPEAKDAGEAVAEAKPADAKPAENTTEVASCKEAAPIDANSKGLRKALQYKEKGDAPEKACRKCVQFEEGKFGACGACKLFTGAVNPGGTCLSFAPIAAK